MSLVPDGQPTVGTGQDPVLRILDMGSSGVLKVTDVEGISWLTKLAA